MEGDGVAGHGVRSVGEDRLNVYRGALDLDVAGDEVLVLVTDPLPARKDLALGDLDGSVGGGSELSKGGAGRKGGGGYDLVALVEVHGGELNTLDSLYRLLFGCKRLSNWSDSLTNCQRSTQTGCDCGVSPPPTLQISSFTSNCTKQFAAMLFRIVFPIGTCSVTFYPISTTFQKPTGLFF